MIPLFVYILVLGLALGPNYFSSDETVQILRNNKLEFAGSERMACMMLC